MNPELEENIKIIGDPDTLKQVRGRRWFITINNPGERELYIPGAKKGQDPKIVKGKMDHAYIKSQLSKLGENLTYYAMSDEIGLKNGTYHTHLIFCVKNAISALVVNKLFYHCDRELQKGSCQQARAYIRKEGKYADSEKADTSVEGTFEEWGEIPVDRGQKKKSLQDVEADILGGATLLEIKERYGILVSQHWGTIKSFYLDQKKRELGIRRKNEVFYHVGESGSGKSFVADKLYEELGEGSLYMFTDHQKGGLDNYAGEPILFVDEFRGTGFTYSILLSILGDQVHEIGSRYANTTSLWTSTHITSVLPPEVAYKQMVPSSEESLDSFKQMLRRIDFVVYHYKIIKNDVEVYREYRVPSSEYKDYESLKSEAVKADPELEEFLSSELDKKVLSLEDHKKMTSAKVISK